MPLTAGTRLGPYEILAPIGAGGMGEVYRARDDKLGREVALKVLPEAVAAEPERLARFEREARVVAALSHPNILAIHDFGSHSGVSFAAMELLEGETLRDRLRGGPPPPRKAVEYAVQIAHGLAAAHEKGVTHRDLKPENVFVTTDGRVKILDFGLARQTLPTVTDDSPTRSQHTEPGTVLGTPGYMAPEQVRGLPTDPRTDIFALGAVLFEMLTGRRAFARQTPADTLSAILREDPSELLTATPAVPAGLARIVQHCLEKSPAERFQSARDLAFDLAALVGSEGSPAGGRGSGPPLRALERYRAIAAGIVLAVAGCALGYWAARRSAEPAPSFRPLTFRRGHVTSARFMPDGQTIVYGAMWEGAATQMFSVRLGAAESTQLPLPPGDVLAVSRSGELLVSLGRRFTDWFISSGRLARAPPSGAAPRELLDEVQEGDWTGDAERLLVVRHGGGKCRLELPAGNVLYETAGWVSHARLSPKGDLVAFMDHPFRGQDYGALAVVPASGRGDKKLLTGEWWSIQGLAWDQHGREIWFTAAETGWHSALYAATPAGERRLVLRTPGRLQLHDRDSAGRLLLTRETVHFGALYGRLDGEERDLSWLDTSIPISLSNDGRKLIINEQGEGAGPRFGVYLRETDGSPAVRLGDGVGGGLSPDGRSVGVITQEQPPKLALLPTGAGERRELPPTGIFLMAAGWFPDSRRIAFSGFEQGRGSRVWVQDLAGGAPKAITPEGFGSLQFIAVSPDARWIASAGPGNVPYLSPVDGGEPVPLPGLQPGDNPLRFTPDAKSIFISRGGGTSATILRYDLGPRTAKVLKELRPRDSAGTVFTQPSDVTPDGRHYVYVYIRDLSELFLVEGLR